jgi:hypothetical protein
MGRNLFAEDNKPEIKRPGRNLFANSEAEDESFLQKLPRNIVAGLAQGGHEFLNAPHTLAKNIEQRGIEFGKEINNNLPLNQYANQVRPSNFSLADLIPYQEEHNYAQLLGQKGKGTFSDNAIQNIAEYAPELLMGANALKVLPHLTKRGATKTLKKAQKLAEERDIGTLNVNPELIEDARKYLPDDLPIRDLINASQSGDYNSLFKLQSDVGKISAARMGKIRSLFAPETHIKGQAGLESRERLLDAIHENLQGLGHDDISALLRQGQNEYRRYMKFKKYRNALGVLGASYLIPKNPITDFMKNIIAHGNQ